MKTIAGIYDTREQTLAAIEKLKKSRFPDNQITLVNKDELLHNHIRIKATGMIQRVEVIVGFFVGLIIGVLVGLGYIAVPGLESIFGVGVVQGALSGSILGAWFAGMIAIFTTIITNRINANKYEKHLNEGKFLLFVEGTPRETQAAHKILDTPDVEMELG